MSNHKKMSPVSLQLFARNTLSLLLGAGSLSLLLSQPSLAQQTTYADPLQSTETQNSTNPFYNPGNEDSMDTMFDMIHRAQLGPSRSMEEYASDQQNSLDAAAAEFRARQQQMLQQPNPAVTTTEPVVNGQQ